MLAEATPASAPRSVRETIWYVCQCEREGKGRREIEKQAGQNTGEQD